MIITCPECATRYQADAAKFPPAGRKVKCAKCGHAWHQMPELDDLEDVAAPEPVEPAPPPPPPPPPVVIRPSEEEAQASAFAPEPVYAPAARTTVVTDATGRSSLPTRLGTVVAWALPVLILVAAGWAALQYRQTVATLWPQTASLYAALGLPVNSLGIDIVDLAYKRERQDGQIVLAVTGRLVNITGRELPVLQLRAALRDPSDRELYHWTFSSGVVTIRPGQSVKFLTRLSSPPAGASGVRVTFTKNGE